MGQKELESRDSVTFYPEVVREGVHESNLPPRPCRGIKRDLWKRVDSRLSSASISAGRARRASTRGTSHSRKFVGTATRSSTSSQSNWRLSRGSGRGKGVEIHGRRGLCSWRGQERVETDFRELVLHVLYSYWVPNRERFCEREVRNWRVSGQKDQHTRYLKINLVALRLMRSGLAITSAASELKCSPSPETTEAMRGKMAETLVRSSEGEEASEAGESTRHLAFFLLMGREAVGDLNQDWPATGGREPVSLDGKERAGVTSFQVSEPSSYSYSGLGLQE